MQCQFEVCHYTNLTQRRNTKTQTHICNNNVYITQQTGLLAIIGALRQQLNSRGVQGWVGLRRALRAAATSDISADSGHVSSDVSNRRVTLSGLKRAAAAVGLLSTGSVDSVTANASGGTSGSGSVGETEWRLLYQHLEGSATAPVTVGRVMAAIR
jgi:hypothetical protein